MPGDPAAPPLPWYPFIPPGRLIPADAPDDYITLYPAYAWSTQQPPPFLAPGAINGGCTAARHSLQGTHNQCRQPLCIPCLNHTASVRPAAAGRRASPAWAYGDRDWSPSRRGWAPSRVGPPRPRSTLPRTPPVVVKRPLPKVRMGSSGVLMSVWHSC